MASGSSKGKQSKGRSGSVASRSKSAPVKPPSAVRPTDGMTSMDRIVWVCLHLLVFLVPIAMTNANWLGSVSGAFRMPFTYDQFDIAKVFIMRVFAIGGLMAWSLQFFLKGGKIRRTKLDYLILAFLAWVLITSFVSISPATALFGKYRRFEGFFSFVIYAIVYFLVVQMVDRPSRIRSLARTLAFSGLVVAGYGVLQYLGADPINWGTKLPFEANRAFSTFGNPDLLGGYLVFPLAISVAMALSEDDLKWRAFYWFTFLVTAVCWVVAYVRGAWIGGAVALLALAVAAFLAKPRITKLDWGFFGVTGLTGGILIGRSLQNPNAVLNIGQRIASIFQFKEGSALTRFEIWQAAIDAIKARPITGFGADTFRLVFPKYKPLAYVKDAGYLSVADNVHNYPLQLMAGIGIVGFLLLYAIFGWALWLGAPNAFSRGKGADRLVVSGFWAAALGYVTHLMFGLSVTGSTVFLWLALAVIMSPTAREHEFKITSWSPAVGLVTMVVLAVAWIGNGVYIAADNYYLRGQFPAQGENPIVLLQTAISLNPWNDMYRSQLGQAHQNQMLNWLNEASTQQSAGSDPSEAVKQAQESFKLAEEAYKATIEMVPTEYDNYIFLSSLYNQAGTYFDPAYLDDAIATADKGTEVEPFGPAVRMQKAVAQAAKGDRKAAIETLDAAVDMDPAFLDIRSFYAQILLDDGRLKDSLAQYRILSGANPGNTTYTDAIKSIEASLTAAGESTSTP